jgi:hypothetical protein
VQVYSELVLASHVIKSWLRSQLAYRVLHAKLVFHVWNKLESIQEQEVLKKFNGDSTTIPRATKCVKERLALLPASLDNSLPSSGFPSTAFKKIVEIQQSTSVKRGIREENILSQQSTSKRAGKRIPPGKNTRGMISSKKQRMPVHGCVSIFDPSGKCAETRTLYSTFLMEVCVFVLYSVYMKHQVNLMSLWLYDTLFILNTFFMLSSS